MVSGVLAAVGTRFSYVLKEKIVPGTNEFGIVVAPIITYWVLACFYDALDTLQLPIIQRFKIVRKQPGRGNQISKGHVIFWALMQHLVQFMVGFIAMMLDPEQCEAKPGKGWLQSCFQFLLGMLIMDTWQFWIHRYMHVNTYLYKHCHSHHHRLAVPFAYGALYNHPLEGLLLDTLGGAITLYASNMSCGVGVWCLNFATAKTVLDHCGYLFPVNPLHNLFPNSTAYHDIHHDVRFIKKNYSQPFFTHWDILLGSYKSTEGFHVLPGESKGGSDAADTDTSSTKQVTTQNGQKESRKDR